MGSLGEAIMHYDAKQGRADRARASPPGLPGALDVFEGVRSLTSGVSSVVGGFVSILLFFKELLMLAAIMAVLAIVGYSLYLIQSTWATMQAWWGSDSDSDSGWWWWGTAAPMKTPDPKEEARRHEEAVASTLPCRVFLALVTVFASALVVVSQPLRIRLMRGVYAIGPIGYPLRLLARFLGDTVTDTLVAGFVLYIVLIVLRNSCNDPVLAYPRFLCTSALACVLAFNAFSTWGAENGPMILASRSIFPVQILFFVAFYFFMCLSDFTPIDFDPRKDKYEQTVPMWAYVIPGIVLALSFIPSLSLLEDIDELDKGQLRSDKFTRNHDQNQKEMKIWEGKYRSMTEPERQIVAKESETRLKRIVEEITKYKAFRDSRLIRGMAQATMFLLPSNSTLTHQWSESMDMAFIQMSPAFKRVELLRRFRKIVQNEEEGFSYFQIVTNSLDDALDTGSYEGTSSPITGSVAHGVCHLLAVIMLVYTEVVLGIHFSVKQTAFSSKGSENWHAQVLKLVHAEAHSKDLFTIVEKGYGWFPVRQVLDILNNDTTKVHYYVDRETMESIHSAFNPFLLKGMALADDVDRRLFSEPTLGHYPFFDFGEGENAEENLSMKAVLLSLFTIGFIAFVLRELSLRYKQIRDIGTVASKVTDSIDKPGNNKEKLYKYLLFLNSKVMEKAKEKAEELVDGNAFDKSISDAKQEMENAGITHDELKEFEEMLEGNQHHKNVVDEEANELLKTLRID
jgi:heme/copper-type cytochrome/quinol oxidase subunit 2